jgi:DNA-binding Lrp family transcriptional regulator
MGKPRIWKEADARNIMRPSKLDERDQEILGLLVAGANNRVIATKLRIPMSTVQRRTRRLFERDVIKVRYELNHKKLGFRKGLLHVYLKDGNMKEVAEQIAGIDGMQSTSIHIGNSDIIGLFVFRETHHLLDILSACKKITSVERVVWSEEVMNMTKESARNNQRQLVTDISN